MTPRKIEIIKNRLFKGKQKEMAEKLGVSGGKISAAISGKLGLASKEIGILLTQYHIDPYWFFNEDPEDRSDVKFNSEKESKNENTAGVDQSEVIKLVERQLILMEKMEEYNRSTQEENIRLKNDKESVAK